MNVLYTTGKIGATIGCISGFLIGSLADCEANDRLPLSPFTGIACASVGSVFGGMFGVAAPISIPLLIYIAHNNSKN